MMRFYDKNHYLVKEIDYHPEQNLTGNRHEKILHVHEYDRNFKRTVARPISKQEYELYKKYFKGVTEQ